MQYLTYFIEYVSSKFAHILISDLEIVEKGLYYQIRQMSSVCLKCNVLYFLPPFYQLFS